MQEWRERRSPTLMGWAMIIRKIKLLQGYHALVWWSVQMANSSKDSESAIKKTLKRPPQDQSLKDDAPQPPPAKKAKKNHTQKLPSAETVLSSLPNGAIPPTNQHTAEDTPTKQPTAEIPSEVRHLASKYDFAPMSVMSSSKMEHKIRNILERVSKFSFTEITGKPGVVILHAQAKYANKLITIAEVSKREIEKDKGTWWQYTKLEGQLMEMQIRPRKPEVEIGGKTLATWEAEQAKRTSGDGGADVEMGDSVAESNINDHVDDSGGVSVNRGTEERDEEVEEDFETMTVPATDPRLMDGRDNARKKVRALPVMTIYLARVPIPGLKELYG